MLPYSYFKNGVLIYSFIALKQMLEYHLLENVDILAYHRISYLYHKHI